MINLKLYLKNTLCIILVLSILFNISFVYAGWLSDWYSNTQVTAPGVLKTQEAGYLIGGSFTFKTKLRSDYLFSIEAPRINIGCGGIDIFLGSFRYLEPKYLIEKAKRIIQAAPYFAFQLALSALCEKCAQILSYIESVINFLNSLQLDECKAAKAIVAMGADAIQNQERFVDTVKSNIQSGIEDLWNEAASRSNNQGVGDWVGLLKEAFGLKNSLAGDIAKCLKSSLNDGKPCYILDLYYERYSDTSNIIPKGVLRAYVGDIYILADKDGNASSFGILYPDSKLEHENILEFKTKVGKIVNSGKGKPGNIKSEDESGYTIKEEVEKSLNSVVNVYKNYKTSSLSSSDIAFIEKSPLPIAAYFRSVLLLHNAKFLGVDQYKNTLDSYKTSLVRPLTYMFIDVMMQNLRNIVYNVVYDVLNAVKDGSRDPKKQSDFETLKVEALAWKENFEKTSATFVSEVQQRINFMVTNNRVLKEMDDAAKQAQILVPKLLNSVFGKPIIKT